MPDASRHCKRPALELGARWSNEALRGHPTTGSSAEPGRPRAQRRAAKRSGTAQGQAQARQARTSPGPRTKAYAFPRRGRGCDSWKAKTRARDRDGCLPSTRRSIAIVGSATIVAGLRCAASAREPPSSPKHSFNPPRAVAPLPALDHEPYASPARTRAL